ncbi:MAG: hypothetical protein H7301_03715 [Cryobacterium sp.]|nr:hypothetical protein [Oligoflexia bacterium]
MLPSSAIADDGIKNILTPVRVSCRGELGNVKATTGGGVLKYALNFRGRTASDAIAPIDNERFYSEGGSTSIIQPVYQPQRLLDLGGMVDRCVRVPASWDCSNPHRRFDAHPDSCVPVRIPARVIHPLDHWFVITLVEDVPGTFRFQELNLKGMTISTLGPSTQCQVQGI